MNAGWPARGRLRVSRLRGLNLAERVPTPSSLAKPNLGRPRVGRPDLRRPRLGRPRLRRPTLRSLFSLNGLAVLAVLALLLGGGWLWLRSSSLVQIKHVRITGLSGPDVKRIRRALADTARSMTTLNLSVAKLDAAVSAYPDVKGLKVSTQFPHGVTIAVDEQVPIAQLTIGGKLVVVDAAGQLLRGSSISHGLLPKLLLRSTPSGQWVTAAGPRAALTALEWAPYRMLSHVRAAGWSSAHGVVIRLRHGPQLYLGPATQLSQKWSSAIAVLADPGSKGAQYIDVSDPRRPAAGVHVTSGG